MGQLDLMVAAGERLHKFVMDLEFMGHESDSWPNEFDFKR